ncbi:MAG: 30S ribosome-binding factor RbfA [Alphaproteobacteria bacterium]|nr:30S ribosome-binding factor RbfA [Alphaproteobacteria bacterium]
MRSKKAPSERQLKVANEIKRVLGMMLIHNDLFIAGLKASYVMITDVDISPDLSFARIFIRAIEPVDSEEQVELLQAHKGVFRKEIGHKMMLRIVPDLDFVVDTRLDNAQHIDELLSSPKVKADIEKYKE